jgi:hypothetical protein
LKQPVGDAPVPIPNRATAGLLPRFRSTTTIDKFMGSFHEFDAVELRQ